jgi:predicted lipid-binding transport protein (Tim44 family)
MIHSTDTIERIDHARPGSSLEGGDRDEGDRRGLFGLIGGVVAGLMLYEIIGYLMFDSAVGIKFLPIYLAILFAVVAPAVDGKFRRRSQQPLYRRNQRSRP